MNLSDLSPVNWIAPGTVSNEMMAGGLAGFATGNPAIGMGMMNMYGQAGANKQNMALAQQQMQFQERMSSTAHQREVADLQAAGLNPNLSAGGNGSSTPSGASATMNAPQIDIPAVMSVASLNQNQQRIDIERQNADVDRAKKIAEMPGIKSKKALTDAQTRATGKGAIRAEMENQLLDPVQKTVKWLKEGFNKHWGNSQPPGAASRPKNKPFIDSGWLSNSSNPDN